jgi:hypothetical protein
VHSKVKGWKREWTGELVKPTGSGKRGTDAFTHLQAGEHDPEVIIVCFSG